MLCNDLSHIFKPEPHFVTKITFHPKQPLQITFAPISILTKNNCILFPNFTILCFSIFGIIFLFWCKLLIHQM